MRDALAAVKLPGRRQQPGAIADGDDPMRPANQPVQRRDQIG